MLYQSDTRINGEPVSESCLVLLPVSKQSGEEIQLELTAQWQNTWLLMWKSSKNKETFTASYNTYIWSRWAWSVTGLTSAAGTATCRSEEPDASYIYSWDCFVLFTVGDSLKLTFLKGPTCKRSTGNKSYKQAAWFRLSTIHIRHKHCPNSFFYQPVRPATEKYMTSCYIGFRFLAYFHRQI